MRRIKARRVVELLEAEREVETIILPLVQIATITLPIVTLLDARR